MHKNLKNKQGFTIVELMLSFTLSVIIIIYLFNVILTLRKLYTEDGIKTQMLIKQAGISEEIGKALDTKLVTQVNTCGNTCLRFTFEDKSTADFTWDMISRTVTYNKHTTKYISGTEIDAPSVQIEKVEGANVGTNNAIMTFHLPISHRILGEDFGVTIVYPYDDRITTIPDIKPEDFISVKLSGSVTSGTPTRGSVTLTADPRPKEKDILGGYTYLWQKKDGSNWITVAENNEAVLTLTTEVNDEYRVLIKTIEGNEATSSIYKVIIDTTPPICSFTNNGIAGKNGWYVTRDVTVSLTRSDPGIGSGIASYDITKSSTPSYKGASTIVQSNTAGTILYGYVKDKAGNVGSCNTTIKVDLVAPTCTSAGGSTTWTNGSRTLVGTCSDPISGCSGNISKPYTTQGSWVSQSPGTVQDNAGNTSTCPADQTVKIDKTPPTCTITASGTTVENGWYKSKVKLTLNTSDTGGSSVSAYGLTTSSSVTYNSTTTAEQADTTGTTWYGYVKDGAGNVGSCNINIKVDTTTQ